MDKYYSVLLIFIMVQIYSIYEKSQLDAKMKPLTRFSNEVIWPESEKEMDEVCRYIFKIIKLS